MIALYLFIGALFGSVVGIFTHALFTVNAYEKGYNDALKLVREGGRPE